LQRFPTYRSAQFARRTRIASPEAKSKTLDPDLVSTHISIPSSSDA
jgi:hypothetical protein